MDYMHQTTDKQLKELEKRLKVHYRKANFEMQRKLSEYLKTFDAQDRKMFEQVKSGKITKDKYKKWRSDKVLLAESWKDIRDQIAKDYTNANKQAAEIIAKDIPNVVAENRDYSTYDIEQKIGYDTSFALTDRETVNRLIQERPNLLPSVYASKDTAWNRKLITSAVTQGIIQGESMAKIAKRLTKVTEMNRNSAIRNARTAVTGAENAGRQSGFERASDLGIKLEKQWIATKDGRTRHSHRQVDGEIVPVNETFSNGCEYPADPLGLPEETYNCRCTMISQIKGHEIDRLSELDMSKMGGMSYDEWKASKPNYYKPKSRKSKTKFETQKDLEQGQWGKITVKKSNKNQKKK